MVDFPPVPCVGEKVRSLLEKEEDDTGSRTKLVVVGGIKI